MKKFFSKLLRSNRFILAFLIVTFIFVVAMSLFMRSKIVGYMESENVFLGERLKTAAYALSHAFDIEKLNSYSTADDIHKEDYKKSKEDLGNIAENLEVTFTYFLRRKGDSAQYVIDNDFTEEQVGLATPPIPFTESTGAERCFSGKPYTTEIGEYTEGWDGLVTAFTPVFDSLGNIIYCAGVDLEDVKITDSRNLITEVNILMYIGLALLLTGVILNIRSYKNYSKNLEMQVAQKTSELISIQDSMIHIIANLVEYKDDVTGNHLGRTNNFISIFLDILKSDEKYKKYFDNWDLKLLVASSQLHDVGKIAIADSILKKTGKLTQEEFEEMKLHAKIGGEIISKIQATTKDNNFLRYAKIYAATHHEKWDGSGYCTGLKGEDIPFEGRLMAIADVYDALISVRPYKKAFSHEEAVNIIVEGKGKHFDPNLVDIFVQNSEKFRTA